MTGSSAVVVVVVVEVEGDDVSFVDDWSASGSAETGVVAAFVDTVAEQSSCCT